MVSRSRSGVAGSDALLVADGVWVRDQGRGSAEGGQLGDGPAASRSGSSSRLKSTTRQRLRRHALGDLPHLGVVEVAALVDDLAVRQQRGKAPGEHPVDLLGVGRAAGDRHERHGGVEAVCGQAFAIGTERYPPVLTTTVGRTRATVITACAIPIGCGTRRRCCGPVRAGWVSGAAFQR